MPANPCGSLGCRGAGVTSFGRWRSSRATRPRAIAGAGLGWRVKKHTLEAVIGDGDDVRRIPVPRLVANVRADRCGYSVEATVRAFQARFWREPSPERSDRTHELDLSPGGR